MDHGLIDCGLEPAVAPLAHGPTGPALPWLADEAVNLAALWAELIAGSCKVEATLCSPESYTLVVRRGQSAQCGQSAALSRRDIDILEQSMLAGVRKSVAADHCLCPSSIAEILKRCFEFMGLSCWPSRIPLLLVMAAHAKHAEPSAFPAKCVLAQNQSLARQSISASRPDIELARELSPAEYGVTRLLVEGNGYAQIAELRQTSRRTVANQLASAFQRLDISGRAELLCLLARRRVAHWQAAGPGPVSGRAGSRDAAQRPSGLTRVAG
ncbi:MAG: helix-turn-helix transcriptional regulator [Polyangiaceae bacterium]